MQDRPALETHVLWDIDGTLVYNASSPGNLYHRAVERTVGRELEDLVGHQHGRTDAGLIDEHLRVHRLDAGLREAVSGHLQDLTAERHATGERRVAAVGAAAVIARVAAHGWHNDLLTGNSAFRARLKLEGAGYDTGLFDWENSYFGDEEIERTDVTGRAARSLAGRRAVIIGDTPRDGLAADAVGIPFVAVATGAYGPDALANTAAVFVARDFETDADGIIAAIEALQAI